MEFKALIKNTSYMIVARFAQFIAGLAITKISALLLSTIGVGIISQLNFLTQKMSQFTTLSMSDAVVKQIAENRTKKNISEIISSAFKSYIILVSSFSVISMTLLIIFANTLTYYVFGEGDFIAYFFIAFFTFPLIIISSIPFSILKGFKDIRLISKVRIGIVFTNLLFAVPLIYFYRLDGAVLYVSLSYLIDLLFHIIIAQKFYFKKLQINAKSIYKATFRIEFVKELFYFSGFGITAGTIAIISEFVCRSIVVSYLGVDKIGLYSPIIMWASLMTGFLLPALSTYLYPRFCELETNDEITGLINDALRLGTMVIIPLIFIGIPFRELVISMFYSEEFIGAAKFLPYHFLGLLFYVWWYVLAQAMTPTGRIKQHGIFQILFFLINMLVTYLFVPDYGLYGWMLKHVISPFVFFWVYYLYVKKYMGLMLTLNNTLIMLYLFLGSLVLIFIDLFIPNGNYINFLIGPFLLSIWFLLLKKDEKIFLINKLNSIIKPK